MLLSTNILLSIILIVTPSLTSPILPGPGLPAIASNSSAPSSSSFSSDVLNTVIQTISSQIDSESPPGSPTKGLIRSLPIYQSGWISASTYNTLINYWHLTHQQGQEQNAQPVPVSPIAGAPVAPSPDPFTFSLSSSILAQAGPQGDFSGAISPGNDDQLWWGLTTISAAEYGLPGCENWLDLAKNVFKAVIDRWQGDMCPSAAESGKGGLGWQIDTAKDGYHYKNAITNGLAFQLAARLAKAEASGYTTNFYLDWAKKLWDSGFGSLINEESYKVFDGVHAPECAKAAEEEWSYNVGVWMGGCAVMHQLSTDGSTDEDWKGRACKFVDSAIATFTRNGILYEPRCEDEGKCNDDQQTFKAALARWMGLTATLVPETKDKIKAVLEASKNAALTTVQASPGKNQASLKWSQKDGGGVGYDAKTANGVGAQLGLVELLVQSQGL
ncbi:Mannan endo-1,6-alpha-mannosidase DCW1 [Cercospora beticola]|uniref:mannan endo-1,6-alpha-mannosidase n=1 Tax=Cercospora beticola TaxID=122368 RepID=A0A2G5H959_CERBT|nr:Mannan endo-1,6-alpha-mannosidase DCW1 [Cercospora beticola]PIA89069.1 Mannan endo-1,6-alpha-mannosidase DCW1 [Cercospora beticola]WPB03639.1 hypothetical protein RHO25_008280 [Cercospora beticola]CAK1357614.1 unnamed protein product [Cercospora beticola]